MRGCQEEIDQRVLGFAALLQGVREVRVNQEAERVAVVASSEVAPDSLVTAIESAGRYTATPVEPADG